MVVSSHDHIAGAGVASGPYAGSTLLLIPRILNVSQEMESSYIFTRKQFPA